MTVTIKLLKNEPIDFSLPGSRGIKAVVEDSQITIVVGDYEFDKARQIARTIAEKNPSYSVDDALEWAASRAFRRGALAESVLRLDRQDFS